ncbi:ABC transporter substrate-binding protein [Leucobacter tenebrionis]|uniref:ABC transporter substrate-binding protein n=1 Tax=Leucobacter tenebrionis TaxID=2873270 RepID=UPI001CA63C7F|nr:ABC transporter substrate-binding protein [Leucobacter tenebrionis]QZY51700.1 ABC transporter substrate-binding protein [Leucobacter tenebrionis]
MKRSGLVAALALGAAGLFAVTACAPRESVATESREAVDREQLVTALPAAETPVDEVVWSVVEGEPATLDPGTSATVIIPNLCENLLQLQPDFSIAPGVAESAEWIDPVTFVIELRDDVLFWDGTPLTADDVVYSLQRGQDPASQWFAAFVLVSSIEKTGDLEVTVRFDAPDSAFRDAIAGGAGAVMSKAYGEQAGPALGTAEGGLMCTGPYQLAQGGWTPGSEIVTTANEHYWGGAPLVETLKYVFVTDGSTLSTALTQGEIDGAYNVPPGSRGAFEGEGSGSLILGPSTASFSFGPATADGPAANPAIRQALSLAIDREKYIDTVLNGLGEAQKTIVPPFTFGESEASSIYQAAYDELDAPEVDLERAKQLIEESGEDVSQPLVVAIPAGAKEFQQTAAIIQSAGKSIGLDIEIDEMQPADFGAMFYDPGARDGIDFVATQGYLETPGVIGYPSLFTLPEDRGGVFNWSGYSNDEVTAHMEAARTATDAETAAEEFVAAQRIFAPDQLQVTLAGSYQLTYLSDELTGATTSIAIYSSPWALHLGGK